jgi:membrane associated rhomboid family serine protease
VGLGVISMFAYAIVGDSMLTLAFFPEDVRAGDFWRLITWPIVTRPGIFPVISLVFFWIFGHRVEEMIGKPRYVRLAVLLIVLPPLLVTLVGLSNGGAGGISLLGTAMLVIFAADQPNAPFFFGIPAWVIAVVFVVIDVLQYLTPQNGIRLWANVAQLLLTCALALVVMRQFGELRETMSFIPQVFGDTKSSGSRGGRSAKPAKRKKQSRDFDRVVTQGPWNGPTAGDQAEMDRLLDKMNSVGLSDVERKRLSELGKRLRGS